MEMQRTIHFFWRKEKQTLNDGLPDAWCHEARIHHFSSKKTSSDWLVFPAHERTTLNSRTILVLLLLLRNKKQWMHFNFTNIQKLEKRERKGKNGGHHGDEVQEGSIIAFLNANRRMAFWSCCRAIHYQNIRNGGGRRMPIFKNFWTETVDVDVHRNSQFPMLTLLIMACFWWSLSKRWAPKPSFSITGQHFENSFWKN